MSRMKSIVSDGSGDAFLGRDRRRQNRRKPARCQRRTVSGWTTTIARRHDDSRRAPMSSLIRSMRWSVGRLLRRRRTLTWWRSTAFSMTSSRRERIASTATPAISLADFRGVSCDHSRPTRARTHVRIRETLGECIPMLEHKAR
jgi:hypothetical protein